MLEHGDFDTHMNATAPMIVVLGCLKIDTEVSDASIEAAESNDCREVLRNDGDVVCWL